MKSIRILVALAIVSLLTTVFVRAEEARTEGTKPKCCLRAEKAGKTCSHECCVAAAKENKNCEKCGGTNEAKK